MSGVNTTNMSKLQVKKISQLTDILSYIDVSNHIDELEVPQSISILLANETTQGDLSKDNTRLGLHEFKKKFGGDYIEFMGEFDYVLKPIYYFAFTKLVPLYRNYIKKRKKKELKDEVRNINN